MIHYSTIDPGRKAVIAVAGCGGTGSQVLVMLARLDTALRALGSEGLAVHAFDPDRVSEANCSRQVFYDCDVGKFKSEVLAERLRLCFRGFDVDPETVEYEKWNRPDVLISCVDSRKARRAIVKQRGNVQLYHIDCGNGADFGQVILGNGTKELPWPEVEEPDLIAEGPEDDAPSCSMAEALERQELFVNDYAARIAGTLLWDLFRHGKLEVRGAYFNLTTLMVNQIRIGGAQ